MAMTVGTLLVNVIGDASQLGASLNAAERQIERFGSRLFFLGSRITAGITLPIAGFVTSVNKIGQEFDQAMTESLAIMDNVSGEMRTMMEQRAIDISKSSKFAAKDIAKGYYDLASAGLTAQESLNAIGTVTNFAQAGLMNMGEAGEYLAGATSSLSVELIGAEDKAGAMARVADVLTMANNKALGTIKDFSDALTNKFAPAMKAQNMTLEDGVAMLMVYAEQNIRGKAAGQQAYMVLRDLQGATGRAKKAWDDYGISVFDANDQMRRLPDILDQIQMRMKGFTKGQIEEWLKTGVKPSEALGKAMSDLERTHMWRELKIPDRSRAALQYLLGTADKMREFAADLNESSGATAAVAAKQAEAMAVKWEMAIHRVQAAAIKLYASFKPILADLFNWIGKVGDKMAEWADKFNQAEPSTKKLILVITGITAAIGPAIAALGSFMLFFAGISGTLSSGIKLITGALTSLPTMTARMNAAGWAWVGPTSKTMADLGMALKLAGGMVVQYLPHFLAFYGIFKILQPALVRVIQDLSGVSKWILDIGRTLAQHLGGWEQWQKTISNAMDIASSLMSMMQFGWVQLVNFFEQMVIPAITEAWNDLKNAAIDAAQGIWNAMKTVFQMIASVLPPAMVQAFSGLATAVGYVFGKIIDIVKSALGGIGGIIMNIGARFLPKEMVELGRVFKDVAVNSGGFHDAIARAASGLNLYVNSMGMVDLKARALQNTFASLKGVMGRSGVAMTGEMPIIPLGLGSDDPGVPAKVARDPVNEAYLQLMGEGKKAWQDMSKAFQLHRSEIVANEDAMARLWEVYKGVRDTLGPNGLKKDLEQLFAKEIGIAQFERFRESFGGIWDDMVEGQNALEPTLGLIDSMASASKALMDNSGVRGTIFSPEFFKKHGAAIEDLAKTYERQPPGIRAMIDSYKEWDKAIYSTNEALRLNQLNVEHMPPILEAHKEALAKLKDKENELANFRMTGSEKALKGISKNLEQQRLAMQKESDAAYQHLSYLTGEELQLATEKFVQLKLMQRDYLKVVERSDLEHLASTVGANDLIIRSFEKMSNEAIIDIIRIQLAAKELKAHFDQVASGLGLLAGVFDKDGDGMLTWLAKIVGLMGEATQVSADLKTAMLAVAASFKGGEVNVKAFAGAAIAGFLAIAQAISVMDKATDSASKGKRIMGGAMAGAQLGSAFGPWGTAIGFVGGALVGAIRKSGAEEEMKRIANSFGVSVSEELAKAISDEAEELYGGNRQLAEHMNLGKILEEGGGLNFENFKTFQDRMRDTFVFLQQGMLDSNEAMTMYSENFGAFADFVTSKGGDLAQEFIGHFRVMGDLMKRGILDESDFTKFLDDNFATFVDNMDKSGHVASQAWAEIVRMHADMKQKSQEMMDFLGSQASTAGSSWATAIEAITFDFKDMGEEVKKAFDAVDDAKKKLKEATDPEEIARLQKELIGLNTTARGLFEEQQRHAKASMDQMSSMSVIVLTTFNASMEAGLSWAETMDAIGPSIDALIEGYEDLGIKSDNAAMRALMAMRTMYTENKQLFDGISATTQGMIALSKLGGLTAQAFGAIGESMVALFRRTQSAVQQAGGTHTDALRPFVHWLAEAEYAAQKYGYALDATTQEMIDQAREAGILGERAQTEAEIMEEGFDEVNQSLARMIDSLDRFIGRLDAVAGGINNLPDPTINWPAPPDYSGVVPPNWAAPAGTTYPGVPTDGGGGGGNGGGGGGGDLPEQHPPQAAMTLNFNDAGNLDRTKIEQEYIPIIVESIRTNQRGARTDMQDALQITI